eukprot:CAMPEP_0170907678 /NCGR_PEP_ID=MMETSP0735-20130129/1457_1 /TAXON_ID=186038 /ORGANISM="Fragilariopsis kerguelensis, Strain L26-C5" /LENGTH=41 /DNA_ID= /DNA_START= /DNA_END= /DNA_ORIENTATION=
MVFQRCTIYVFVDNVDCMEPSSAPSKNDCSSSSSSDDEEYE